MDVSFRSFERVLDPSIGATDNDVTLKFTHQAIFTVAKDHPASTTQAGQASGIPAQTERAYNPGGQPGDWHAGNNAPLAIAIRSSETGH